MSRFSQNRVWNSTITLFTGSGIGAGLSFLLSVIIGRYLGTEGLGVYAAVLAWIYPLSLLAEGGINTWLVRHLATTPEQTRAAVHSAALTRLITALPIGILLWIFAPFLSTQPEIVAGIRLSAPLIFIVPMTGVFNSVFRAQQWMLPVALLNSGMLLVQFIWVLFALNQGGNVQITLQINLLTSAGQLIAAWLIYWRIQPHKRSTTIPILDMLRQALPFAAAGVLAAIQTRISFLLLEQIAGNSAVGLYAASIRFIEAGRLFPQAYLEALYPTLTSLAGNPHTMRDVFASATRRLLLYGLFAGCTLIITSNLLLITFYGEAFRPAVPVLMLLAISLPLLILKGLRTLYWYAVHQETFTNAVTALAIIIQIAAAYYWVPQVGAIGAALAVVSAECLAVMCLWFRR